MITDEQVRAFKDYYNVNAGHIDVNTLRKALEAYEASKWVKFDVNDVSTWPPMTKQPYASLEVMVYCTDNKEIFYESQFVTNLHRLLPTDKGFSYWNHPLDREKRINVTHWQPLPEFKE